MQNSTLSDGSGTGGSLPAQLYAMPYFLATNIELAYDPLPVMEFSQENLHIPLLVSFMYLLMVFFGPKIMASRAAFDLKYPLAIWNGLLFVFSLIGMFKTVSVRLLYPPPID